MEQRELGRTGEKIPTIGIGTWKVGNYSGSEQRARQVEAIRKGIELGMNLIDTAEMYSAGRSEEVVGEAVRGRRDHVFIASKVSPGHLRHDDVIAACEASLRRLGINSIDLYQVHWPDPAVPIKETMSAMDYLLAKGMVRYVGVSNFSVQETENAMAALSKGEVVSNQVEYSLHNKYPEKDILPYCSREKVTLIAYSPLARGDISRSIPGQILDKYGITPAQAMLNWVTRNEEVIAIPKALELSHLEENSRAVEVRFEPSEYEQISAE